MILAGKKQHLIFWPLFAIGLIADLWTKKAVFDWLVGTSTGTFTVIDGLLQLVTAENIGAAFGIAAGKTQMLIISSIIALVIILFVFFISGGERAIIHIALALLAAGVCGNLYDRVFNNGQVRDFLDVYWRSYHWPAFNLADTMLCTAVGLLILASVIGSSSQKRAQKHK